MLSRSKKTTYSSVDPFVQENIAATNGNMYKGLSGKLSRYPIPELRLPEATGQYLLDLGCNWGRWSVAAARKGYQVLGMDPSFEAVLAARRVAAQCSVSPAYIVADARRLPFKDDSFDVVFSFSVLQHFDKESTRNVLAQIFALLKPSGTCFVQMANALGVRNLFLQLKRGLKEPRGFEVRYWSPKDLREVFSSCVGPATLSADGFLSLNAQLTDIDLLPFLYRLIVLCSDLLRRLSARWKWLVCVADSLYVASIKQYHLTSKP